MSPFDPQTPNTPPLGDLAADLALLTDAAQEAAEAAMRHFGKSALQVWDKGGSPVSEGDFAADKVLRARLLGARPDYGWMSEESDDPQSRRGARRVWIVDPIDGTRNYVSGHKDFGVCAALVEDGRPVLGVIAAPARRELYVARKGAGAFLNGERVALAARSVDLDSARILGPGSLTAWQWWKPERRLKTKPSYMGSLALRLCMVGLGRYDATIVVNSFHEWDVAAAEVFAVEAGARVVDFQGRGEPYNQPSAARPNMIAASPALTEEILDRLA